MGRFYVRNFGPETYEATAQNLAIVQSPDGLVYVGNGSGVLEYDGVSWRLIPIPNGSGAYSLAVDSEGRVFVGAVGELGYLAPDSLGRMHYVSLLEHLLGRTATSRSCGRPTRCPRASTSRPVTASSAGQVVR